MTAFRSRVSCLDGGEDGWLRCGFAVDEFGGVLFVELCDLFLRHGGDAGWLCWL
ncbi:hypothetical protein [Edaphobacter acidisoli]|uniref:hypothetical protein n=1 Tax=Edaphobacter acidisoli TaxID=2040573 RepID=UPI00166CECFF|nr:hypothetical protein [Edaphobacter acidisoli]